MSSHRQALASCADLSAERKSSHREHQAPPQKLPIPSGVFCSHAGKFCRPVSAPALASSAEQSP
ncbi:hypothetical protein [Ktedonobacter racemifer]|uniref:hypothetical protein n=1 Tax=Ktedonobacter racemifer TaxID=363277 RepID=UPI0012FB519C|nr:hypothetical protein [Ktedonobacter racemifer]